MRDPRSIYCFVVVAVALAVGRDRLLAFTLTPVLSSIVQERPLPDTEETPEFAAWGIETLERIDRDLRRPGSALYAEYGTPDGKRGGDFGGCAFIWPSSYMLKALAAAARIQPQRYRERMIEFADALDAYWIDKEGLGGYAVLPQGSERYHDDNALMALALIDVYEATRERRFLARAVQTFQFAANGEAKTPGGGIRQHEDRSGPAAVCATAPATLCALRLYRHTGDRSYRRHAERWYRFLMSDSSGLRDPRTGLFHEHNQGSRAYQSAWVLQASLLFYKEAHETKYLEEAQRLASSATARWVLPGGALRETGQWGGCDLCDALLALYQTDGNAGWYKTASGMLRFLHEHGSDTNGRYGEYWHEIRAGQSLPKFTLLHMATVARAYCAAAAAPPPVIRKVPKAGSPESGYDRDFDDSH